MKAFPTTKPLDSWGDPNAGMDLRDYFAAKAMQGFLTESGDVVFDGLAIDSYRVADAMMKARLGEDKND
jgi:hypothetical protein